VIKNSSSKLLILPAIMLVGFIGIFSYIEYRKLTSDKQIDIIAATPITSVAFRLEYATLNLKLTFESYKTAIAEKKKKNLKAFNASFEKLKKYETLLSAFLLQDSENSESYIKEFDRLSYIRSNIKNISGFISDRKYFDKKTLLNIEPKIQTIINTSHGIGIDVEESHQKNLAVFLSDVSKDEKDMALLSVFIIICGLSLIILLIDAIYHFKNNAERAMAAEKTNAIFAAALQSTRVGVLISDVRNKDNPVVFINDAFTRMTGFNLSDIKSNNRDFLFGWNTDQNSIANYKRTMNLHETATIDFLLYKKDGTPFWGEVHLSPVFDSNNELSYYVNLFNDITVFRQTQEDLMNAKSIAEQASAVKTNFLAMMSHEIRTPINGILGVIKLLHETPIDEEQKHLLNIATTSSAALNGIINDILDYAKMEAGKIEIIVEAFSLRELVQEVLDFSSTLLGEKEITLLKTIQDDITDVFVGDVGRLRQILLNLLSNAIKFTDSGDIKINVISLMKHEVDGSPGVLLRVEVQDSGIGISKEGQEHLFQEFSQVERSFTRRFGGTGLGLAICKRLVTLMNGEIGVESKVGKGTKFWFMIPLREANEEDLKCDLYMQDKKDNNYTLANKENKILLVEDNETNRLVVTRYLEKAGVSVVEACNGLEAIEKAKEDKYDLILMDVSMPEMDGMQATGQIRRLDKHNSNVPIVALTAHVMEGDRELCLSAGMNDYLNKPIEYKELLRTLSRWMHVSFDDKKEEKKLPKLDNSEQKEEKKNPKADIVFDISVLKRMADDLSVETVDAVTQSFLTDSKKRIKEFIDNDNLEDIRTIAHTLKSSSANCGLYRFSYMVSDIETACAKEDKDLVYKLLDGVQEIYEQACEALEKGRNQI